MFETLPFVIVIFLFQAPPALGDTAAEKVLLVLVFIAVSSFITWLVARKKNQADIGKLMAETVKTYIDAIDEIMRLNDTLQTKAQSAYDEVDKWRREHRAATALLEQTQDELADCLESRDCHECDEALQRAAHTLKTIKGLISEKPEAVEVVEEIKKLADKIARRKKATILNKTL